jgi:hypothetical protein
VRLSLFRRRKARPVVGYGAVMAAFAAKLKELRDHIAEHDMYVGCEDDVADMDRCLALIAAFPEADFEDEDWIWAETWDLIKDRMRQWWC